jgi:phosphatidylglycerophosphatase A
VRKALARRRGTPHRRFRTEARDELGLPLWHPAALISTWFGTGLLPAAPGTWGALAALPVAWLVKRAFGTVGLAAAAAFTFAVGSWAAGKVAETSRTSDPGIVVIDEAAGQFLALLPAPHDPAAYALAFLLFRLFDMWKPWPIGRLDREVGGGPGIMLDDALAAVYAVLVEFAIDRAYGVRP